MTGIRTLIHLQDAMAKEFSWRKKELHSLKTLVIANEKTHNRDLYIRSAVTMLYAHWEGFVRQIGCNYLEFVGRKKLKHAELASPFLAMAIKRLIGESATTRKMQPAIDVVEFFRSGLPTRCRLRWESGVNTKSNLKSDVFKDIVAMLGLDYSRFSTKEKLIDEKLLARRNDIAHGEYLLVGFDEYLQLHDEMLGIMQDFYNQIDNAAFSGAYRVRATHGAA